jgi:predicted porin
VDYTTEYHAITLALDFQPTQKLNLTGSISYTYSDAGFDNVHFDNILPKLKSMNPTAPQNYAWGAFTMDWPDGYPSFDEMDDFSDLKMETLEVDLGASYEITKNLSVDVNFSYQDFNDEEYYIYDGDGSVYFIGANIRYTF